MIASKTRLLIYAVTIVIAVLACLEGGARLLESYALTPPSILPTRPGWQAEYFSALFDWHEPDPLLLWRFKPHLDNPLITTNSRHVLGPEISLDKPAGTYRVLILGDSSPVGLGLPSRRQTFGQRLQYLLERHWAGRKTVEIVNAAVSGYSSEQVVRYLKRYGWEYEPDLIVLYCGNNDASVSGAFTDRELLSAQKFAGVRNFFSHSAIYRIMRNLLLAARQDAEGTDRPLTVRVSHEQFGENLDALVAGCQRRQTLLVVLKPPVPYLWPAGLQFKPFLQVGRRDGKVLLPPYMVQILNRDIAYCIDRERFRRLYGGGDIFTDEVYRSAYSDTGAPRLAITRYEKQLEDDSLDPVTWNNLGVSYWKLGDYTTGEHMFRTARQMFARRYPDLTSPALAAAVSPILFNLGISLLSQENSAGSVGYDTTGQAFVYLDSAVQCDYFSLRIKKPYWAEIDDLKGTPGVTIIDLTRLFFENGGERLFIDHCHPTAEGHFQIAKTLFDTILDHF